MRLRLLIVGSKSFIPLPWNSRGTRGTTSAEHCYALWLRHLNLMHRGELVTEPAALVCTESE